MIENPAAIEQDFQFGFVMAKTALISNITMYSSNGNIIKSTADASEWAHCFLNQPSSSASVGNYSEATSHNQTTIDEVESHHANGHHANGHHANGHHANGHHANGDPDNDPSLIDICDRFGQNRHGEHISYLNHGEDFKQLVLPIKIAAQSNSTLSFVYEYLLERRDGMYTQSVTVSPGQLVSNFMIRLRVVENRSLKHLKLDIPALGEIKQFYENEWHENEFSYDFQMNLTEQFNSFGQHGYTGDFILSYDLEEDNDVVFDLVTKEPYFVHFYDISESQTMKTIPKHVTFLLDISGTYLKIYLVLITCKNFLILFSFCNNVFNVICFLLQHLCLIRG